MKKMNILIIGAVLLVLAAGVTVLNGCASFGTIPKGQEARQMELSPQYDSEKGHFDNPEPVVLKQLEEYSMNWGDIYKWLVVKGERTPHEAMPQVKPDMVAFMERSDAFEAIWLGHSTILLKMSGKNILIDPVFSKRASPVPFTVGRFQEPALTLEELPEIDYVIISHDHYDHLDMETVKSFREKGAEFFVPLGVGSHLEGWGIARSRIVERDWWQGIMRDDLEFVATPAQHFSGRGLKDRNKTLWASWVIRNEEKSVYFSGDSGYASHFKAIGEAYGPFDVAFIENGQYNIKWQTVHMLPEESAQAYFDLKAEMFIPIHWAMFELSMHTWYQPGMEIAALAEERGINLVTPKLGEVVDFESVPATTAWWRSWVNPKVARDLLAQKELQPQKVVAE